MTTSKIPASVPAPDVKLQDPLSPDNKIELVSSAGYAMRPTPAATLVIPGPDEKAPQEEPKTVETVNVKTLPANTYLTGDGTQTITIDQEAYTATINQVQPPVGYVYADEATTEAEQPKPVARPAGPTIVSKDGDTKNNVKIVTPKPLETDIPDNEHTDAEKLAEEKANNEAAAEPKKASTGINGTTEPDNEHTDAEKLQEEKANNAAAKKGN